MTTTSWVFLGLALVAAVLNWVAVARGARILEYVSKPAATTALLAVAVFLDVSHSASWVWRLAALVFCLLGDVFLMLPRDAFVPGLASFAIAQVLFTVSLATGHPHQMGIVLGAVIVVPVALLLARRFVGALRKASRGDLVAPVSLYMAVISAMTIGAASSGSPVAIAGAALFMLSDSLIAESRFVQPRKWHPVGIMVTYHFALGGLVLALL